MTIDGINDFIRDQTKQLAGNVVLREVADYPGAYRFMGTIRHAGNQSVRVNIWLNLEASQPKITIAYFLVGVGRFYGLCVNVSHKKMRLHKHSGLNEQDRPYRPNDITATANEPDMVWRQFCDESCLNHPGDFVVGTGRDTSATDLGV